MTREEFLPGAYKYMYLARTLDERFLELFAKGLARGTVCTGIGNEGTTVGTCIPFRPGKDPVSLLHRDVAGHLLFGSSIYELLCQYMANAESPTHAREGNVHHGRADQRRYPMISHLGQMLSVTAGATWGARCGGEEVFGLAVIGDGGSSTGDFHETLNISAVHNVPLLLLVQNNHYAFSTPTRMQFSCAKISDRAAGYGIEGATVDGNDPWKVYNAVCDALETMEATCQPYLLESICLRLKGHAAYDKCEYISKAEMDAWLKVDSVPRTRTEVLEMVEESTILEMEKDIREEINEAVERAVKVPRPNPNRQSWSPTAEVEKHPKLPPFNAEGVRIGDAIRMGQEYILTHEDRAFIAGMDVGKYGSAFKTCKGLIDKFGESRVMDMPLAESGILGFCLGSSQTGSKPIVEYQFADFATESTTMLGLNAGTWFFRTGQGAQLLLRLPCGGGLTMGAFHSGEFEGLWSRFSGIKLIYPSTPQEAFEAIVLGFHDPNPCLVFEHKLLYWSQKGDIRFDGNLAGLERPRHYHKGDEVTIITFGAMLHQVLKAVKDTGASADVWSPFLLQPVTWEPILASIRRTGRVMVVQESGEVQGLGSHYLSVAARECFDALKAPPVLVSRPDLPVPFAPELEQHFLPNAKTIAARIQELIGVRK
ncbi:MAG: hypothetical protein JJU11_18025 [Candidatus Sumerlaeia bacterium]|nr:hypothetical protein [Candidatus Sumerlaeia bacterium]